MVLGVPRGYWDTLPLRQERTNYCNFVWESKEPSWIKLPFPSYFAARCGHMIMFWLMKCKQKFFVETLWRFLKGDKRLCVMQMWLLEPQLVKWPWGRKQRDKEARAKRSQGPGSLVTVSHNTCPLPQRETEREKERERERERRRGRERVREKKRKGECEREEERIFYFTLLFQVSVISNHSSWQQLPGATPFPPPSPPQPLGLESRRFCMSVDDLWKS